MKYNRYHAALFFLLCTLFGLTVPLHYTQFEVFRNPEKNVGELTPILNVELKSTNDVLRKSFLNPPDSSRPGVFWSFMDGNISKEGITADLESMKKAGIGHVFFMETNLGIPRGQIDFLSEEWQRLFTHIVREAERLGIVVSIGFGPGWTGSGGPWISGEQSMKHLVHSSIQVTSVDTGKIVLHKAPPVNPYFGEGAFTPELKQQWLNYYEDVAVLAFPTPQGNFKIDDIQEKALYYRHPYTSMPGVKAFYPSYAEYIEPCKSNVIISDSIIDVTGFLKSDSVLDWKVPNGNWTIMRFGCRNNGAVTRPAPLPGLGFEADKCDRNSINYQLDNFIGKLLKRTGMPDQNTQGGFKMFIMDSWEMGAQNWTANFRQEFIKRRGYDPQPFYPVYAGLVVESVEKSERFLWDLRQTFNELVIENYAEHLKAYAKKNHMSLSIEPYDLNPTADMELGAVADVPMCEFWSNGYGFNSSFSCLQAASIAHVEGKKVVAAEAFTAYLDAWKLYPGSMKNQGDWAFATGINKFMYVMFQHQPLNDSLKPGMTFGPYGVHHDRTQTWWSMAEAYHKYIARCQYVLQQGRPVADILYITPEGAPQVFRAPASALTEDDSLPDRRGYNFDGCSPSQIYKATVKNGKIMFPSGATYSLLVLPKIETMTPGLLGKIQSLIKAGATVIGHPPRKSPGLTNYTECDKMVNSIAKSMWGGFHPAEEIKEQSFGKGKIYWGGSFSQIKFPELYPDYNSTASLLRKKGLPEDFLSTGPVRYTHQIIESGDVYFVSNKTNADINVNCLFRVQNSIPEIWLPMTGEIRKLTDYLVLDGQIQMPLQFAPYESYFIVFTKGKKGKKAENQISENFPELIVLSEISKPWEVSFDPKWGGPKSVVFDKLCDWTTREEEGIKYYSGKAIYHTNLELEEKLLEDNGAEIYIDLGEVNYMARVWVNGRDMGVVWSAPMRLKISEALVVGENKIDIEVANLWPNRLIGDEHKPNDGIVNGAWPEWLQKGFPRTSGRFTFTTFNYYNKNSTLLKSGLIGPVRIIILKNIN